MIKNLLLLLFFFLCFVVCCVYVVVVWCVYALGDGGAGILLNRPRSFLFATIYPLALDCS